MISISSDLDYHRPRERLLMNSAKALSDQDLIEILLGSGSVLTPVSQLAKQVLQVLDSKNGSLSPEHLQEINGIGPAKASLICAAFELARRRIRPAGNKIKTPADIYPLLRHFADRPQEHFIVISLNGAHEVISIRVVTVGLINSAPVHPREVFAEALTERAAAIIVAHNHPSGVLEPSEPDKAMTKTLKEAGKILGIPLLDHVIFAMGGYLSFEERGMM